MPDLSLTKRSTKGSPINVTEHDQNLTDIETEVNALRANVGSENLVAVEARVEQNEFDIAGLESDMTIAQGDITTNTAAIGLNTTHRTTVTGNPHAVTNSEVGLANVTNHAQMKRDAGDMGTFTGKTTPVDADVTVIEDSEAANVKKSLTWGNIKATMKTYFDGLYNVDSTAVVYVGKHGDDGNDGLTPHDPKLTIQAGCTAGESLLGGGVDSVKIVVMDGGTYDEDLDINAGINVFAPSAILVGEVNLAAGSSLKIHTHYAETTATGTVTMSGAADLHGFYEAEVLDTRGTTGTLTGVIGLINGSGGAIMFAKVGVLYVGADSGGISDAAANFGHIHFIVQDLYLAGNNAVGMGNFTNNSDIIGYVDHILEQGTPSNTTAIVCNQAGAEIKLTTNEIIADVAWNISAGDVYLNCPKISGTRTGDPTVLNERPKTDAEIKTAYENNADTNAFTDADESKLDGIEAAADVTDATNVAAAGAVMESDFNAKGDILSASADNTPVILTVGVNGKVLTADSGQASGLKWGDAGSGDVSSASNITDNTLVRGDGGAKGVQESAVSVSDAGEMTNPSQPAFLAHLTSTQTNVTGDGTTYNITGAIWTEDFDQGSNFSNGTFTAPVTGKYAFNVTVRVDNITAAFARLELHLYTSNGVKTMFEISAGKTYEDGVLTVGGSIITDMDVNDTSYIRLTVSGSDKILKVLAPYTNFSGALIC